VKRPLVCLLAALALDAPVSGQSTAFEVVSIKPAPQNDKELKRHLSTKIDPAMADFGGVSIMMLITRAYGLNSFQVLGAPELNTTRFDILAKLPAGSSTAQVPEMLKTLLRERFRLEAHQDSRDFGVYALTAAKGGPKVPSNRRIRYRYGAWITAGYHGAGGGFHQSVPIRSPARPASCGSKRPK